MSLKKIARPSVGVIMGSQSDWKIMRLAVEILECLQIPCEKRVISAHRTPDLAFRYARSAEKRGLKCIIAGAGAAAHLAGVMAGLTHLPVLGVPIRTRALDGLDSLLSIAQMPAGIPVATFSVGESGAVNAAFFAAHIVALNQPSLKKRLSQILRHIQSP